MVPRNFVWLNFLYAKSRDAALYNRLIAPRQSIKQDTTLVDNFAISRPISKFFRRQTRQKTCNEVIVIESTAPHTRHYTTL